MSPTTRSSRARKQAAAPVYPALPNTEHPGFWLAAFLRDVAEFEAITRLKVQSYKRKTSTHAEQIALISAQMHLKEDLRETAEHAAREGLLPFAHVHTTYFDQQVAA